MTEMEMSLIQNNSKANYSWEIGTTEDPNFRYWYDYYTRQGELLTKYGSPIFLFIGLVGNALSLGLIARRPFRQMSSGVYLLVLAVTDLLICALGIADWIPEATMGFSLTDHKVVCKVMQYFSKVLEQTSSWMVVAITVERAAIVIRPHKAMYITTRKVAWILTAAIVTILAVINIRQPFIVGLDEDGECFFIKQLHEKLGGIVLALLDLLIYSLFPSIILIACNVALAVKLQKQHKDCLVEDSEEVAKKHKKQIIAMVIALSILFVVLTLPHSCFIISDFIPPKLLWVPVTRELWFDIVSLLVTINHSINVFIYLLTFTHEFRDLFRCCKCFHKTQNEGDMSETHCSVSTVM